MTAHVRGSKCLKIIQNYLNGKEDDEFEVFPTKTENKYIVRPHKAPISKPKEEPPIVKPPKEELHDKACETVEKEQQDKSLDLTQAQACEIIKPKPTPQQFYDPTINIEILNQLKLLGEEMKNSREKKEQKRIIKEVVNKQMMKPRYNYMQPQYIQEPNDKACEIEQEEQVNDPPPIEQSIAQPMPRYFKRRNNIFSDMYNLG